MVGKVIRDYMEGGAKKLTVPGFGTFMRRESGEVIFVDLLRGDDHTLSEMVEDSGGYSEVEAMALVDRFIFETKNAIEHNGSAVIEDLGTMTLDHKGVYQFRYSPKARPAAMEHAVQESLFGGEPRRSQTPQHPRQSAGSARPVQSQGSAQPRQPKPASSTHKPATPAGRSPLRPASERTQPRPQGRKPQKKDRKASRTDTILVIAIIAAAIALVAMIFGFSAGNMPFLTK